MGGQPDEGSVVGVGEDECVTTGGQVGGGGVGGHVTTGGQVGQVVGGHVTGGQVGQVGQVVDGGVDGHVTTGEVSVHVVGMVEKITVTMSGSIYNKGAYTACNVHRHRCSIYPH